MKKIKKRFIPDTIKDTVYDIDIGYLEKNSIRGIIFDIDNTLVPYDTPLPTEEVSEYLTGLAAAGYQVCFVSNNKAERVELFNRTFNFRTYPCARKPSARALTEAVSHMRLNPGQVLMVGDQLFTDIYAARRAGTKAALVRPIKPVESLFFKIKRMGEKPFLRHYYKRCAKETGEE